VPQVKFKAPSTFNTLAELEAIPAPLDKPAIYVRHASDSWFGCCINKPKKNGEITRQWFVRLGDERRRYAHTSQMGYSDARKEARRLYAEHAASGRPSSYRLRDLWLNVKRAKQRNERWSECTLENYEKFVPPEGKSDPTAMPVTATYVLPIWNLKLSQITKERLRHVLDAAEADIQRRWAKTPRKYTGKSQVSALASWLRMLFEYAVRQRRPPAFSSGLN
jgi:hypothetical protein